MIVESKKVTLSAFCIHPEDYLLVQQAMALERVSLAEFLEMAAYRYARQVLVYHGLLEPVQPPPRRLGPGKAPG